MAKKNNILVPKSFALAFAGIILIVDIVAFIWHGMMQQPSMMNFMYSGFWVSPVALSYSLIVTVAGAYLLGYTFAWIYNKANEM